MKQGILETIVGFAVLITATIFFFYAYNISNSSKPKDGYRLIANFENIDGLSVGSDVKVSGIKIGYVENIELDGSTFFAKVLLRIDSNVQIPVDSRAIVSTTGLIGNKYIRVNPGASDENLKEDDKFRFTQSALNIEDLIAKLMYSVTSK